jgi:hypothetical protein
MTYTLAPFVTDEMLKECGFEITQNAYTGKNGYDFKDCFEAIRNIDSQYDIVVQDRTRDLTPLLYDKTSDGDPYDVEIDIVPYIQDLISKGYVIENG